MDVKPWEPVSGWFLVDRDFSELSWPWEFRGDSCSFVEKDDNGPLQVTLANGQRIIVRALSEDRKAARAAMKRKPRPGIPAFGGLK